MVKNLHLQRAKQSNNIHSKSMSHTFYKQLIDKETMLSLKFSCLCSVHKEAYLSLHIPFVNGKGPKSRWV